MAGFNTGALAMRHLAQLAAPASHPDPTADAGAAEAAGAAGAGAAAAVRPLDDQLAAACRLGSAAAVRSALAEGADPSFVAPGGRSPVFEAAYHGHLEVLALLCDRDADVGLGWTMAMTGMTYTAREIALLCGHFQVVQVLDAVAGRGLATARQRLAWAQIVHGRLGPGEVAPVPGGRHALLSRDLLRLVGGSRSSLCPMPLPDRLPLCPQARCVAPAAVCVRLEHPGQPVAARSFFLGPPGRTAAAAGAQVFQTAGPREPEVAAGAEERRCPDSDSDSDGDRRKKRRKEKKRKRKKRKRKKEKKEKKAKHKRRRRSDSAEASSLSS